MNPTLLLTAYYHHGDTVGWLAHSIGNAIIHALIYGLIFRLMRHLSLGEAALLVIVILGGLFLWARARDRRRW
ncbi:hypothetical protein [Acidisoma sp. 7E03]